ncbi:tyrosine-type recombinase/integrase [Leptospira bandrabouensis]|uniref:Site-specific integrase n=1 Tax=Leptospira bandrabouensis TaxID=2484903 RepID=A0A6H3NJS7_9LEPT|nr:site-specific integrase [Leptospira bandrabouensis]TGN11608.1 site-specific integrase [Leptospira bandrabouensis]
MKSSKVIHIAEFRKTRVVSPPRKPTDSDVGIMLTKGLSDVAMKELVDKFETPTTEAEYRNRAIFAVMSTTGLRAREVVSLKFSSLFESPEGLQLLRYYKKGGGEGIICLNSKALDTVRKYHKRAGLNSDFFFLSLPEKNRKFRHPITTRTLQNIVRSWEQVTVSGRMIHPHSLRHTVAQRVMNKFGSIATQKLLGHASPTTTARYYTKPYFDASDVLVWK